MSRDWMGSLWPASYAGVPFYVRTEGRKSGRRIVTHEFPKRDTPFNEDLGAKARHFAITAYLASDSADADAAALEAACNAKGASTLVLPYLGIVTARAIDCDISGERDELGMLSARLDFVLEGAASALASVNALAASVFAATGALGAIAATICANMVVVGLGAQVASNLVAGLQTAVASLEVIRSGYATDTTLSAASSATLSTLYAACPVAVSRLTGVDTTIGAGIVDAAQALGSAMPAATAVEQFGALADSPPLDVGAPSPPLTMIVYTPAQATPANRAIQANAARLSRLVRLAALSTYAEALVNQTYASRQDGIAARALCSERFDAAIAECSGAETIDLATALIDLQGKTIAYLSQVIATLAPVVTVSANKRLPAVWWAWRLYADPTRDAELVARNTVTHPGFMPLTFEALAS